ncbi:MAG: spore cortex-lytic enzyme [Christensenellales bacterium]|jgi:N-acetylmuramoyl-L-alanine amidase
MVNKTGRRKIKITKAQGVLAAAVLLLLAVCISLMTAAEAATLAWGSTGSDVRKVQQRLKEWGYYKGTVDGVFGQATYDAVIYFQRSNGLTADGRVGARTAAAIGITLSGGSSSSASGNYSSADIYLLARTIHAEARGEPYTGQVAVGAVILNRVKHPSFPNSISGVVYQPGAFSAVYDGQMNLEPNEESLRAARDAMNGWDPSGGAIYYYNPNRAVVAWIFNRQTITTIGKHRFAI